MALGFYAVFINEIKESMSFVGVDILADTFTSCLQNLLYVAFCDDVSVPESHSSSLDSNRGSW